MRSFFGVAVVMFVVEASASAAARAASATPTLQ